MKKLIKAIEKMKPFFDAVARNVYLKSIKDGFISWGVSQSLCKPSN